MGLLADTPMEQLMDVIQNMRPLPSAPIYDPNAPRFDDPLPVYATDLEEQNPGPGPDRPATPTLRDRIAAIMHSGASPQLRRSIFRSRSTLSMAGSEAPASSADPARAAPSSFTVPSSTVIPSTHEPSSGASTPVGRGSASHIFLAPFVLAAAARAASVNSRASSRLGGGGADSDPTPVQQRNSLLAIAAESALPAVGEEADHASVPASLPNSRGSTPAPFSPVGSRPASPTPTSFAGLLTNASVANSVTGSAVAAVTAATSIYGSATSLPLQVSNGVTSADHSPSPGPTPPPSSASPAASMALRSTRRPSSSARALRRHAAAATAAVAPRTRAVAVASVGTHTNPIDRLLLRTRGPVVFQEARLSDREYEVAARAQRRAARCESFF
ncbi:hypothetical protein HK405_010451 [Cladochytrium tenue]|nr:hypothetical protein HK405_010451 [Cladochytrium tenue]